MRVRRVRNRPPPAATLGVAQLVSEVLLWGLRIEITSGATHVVLYPCNPDESYAPDSAVSKNWNWPLMEALAPQQ